MRRLPLDRPTCDRLTGLLIAALTGLGLAYRRKDGTLQPVTVKRRLLLEDGGLLLVELDTERLPHGVNAADLVAPRTLHHLGAVVHHPVKALNHVGVTLAIILDPAAGRVTLPATADLAEALRSWEGQPYCFPLGAGPTGPRWEKLRGHYLVGGETGSGKTTFLLATGLALSQTTPPAALRLVVIDPKAVDLATLGHLPQAQGQPVATTPDEAAALMADLVGEIEQRQRAFLRHLARDLDGYNAKNPAGGPLPRILVVVDEVTDLALTLGLKSPFFQNLTRAVSLGRAFGLHLILATQNPKAEVLNTLIRGNLAGRIAFRVTTPEHSRVILGESGAERLPRVPGRLLARLGDGRRHTLQGFTFDPALLAALAPSPTGGDSGARPALRLDAATLAMVQYARTSLDGRFGQADLLAGGWSRRTYRRAVDKLKALNVLHHDPAQGNALYLDVDRVDHLDGLTL